MSRRRARPRARLAISLLVLGALFVTLGATSASAAPLGQPSGFTLKASRGYSIFVVGVAARKGRPAAIAIFVTGRDGGAFYSAPAVVTETSIQADLGALGEIAVAFHPSGEARKARSVCSRQSAKFDSGYYEGTIDFHGEQGYTEVEAVRARGDVGFLLDLLCPGISGTRGPFLPGAELEVDSPRLGPHLKVVKNRRGAPAHFETGISEKQDGISISRFISTVAPPHAFEYDPKVQTATVDPPAPFSGTARFHRNAKPANRWTGDLTVDLPGRADVKLTGNDLRASLVHAHWSWRAGG